MVLKQKYQHAPSAIASFAYTEISEGTGVVLFNGLSESDQSSFPTFGSTAYKYALSSEAIESETQETVGVTTTDDGVSFEKDFDLSAFNFPQILRGTAKVTVNINLVGEGDSVEAAFTASVRKVGTDGEVVIANGFSNPAAQTIGASTDDKVTIPITIPLTPFKKGVILRLTIIGNTVGSPSTMGGTIKVKHDPTTADYELKFYCPFNLDL